MNGKKEAKWICLVYSPNAFVSVFVEVDMRINNNTWKIK